MLVVRYAAPIVPLHFRSMIVPKHIVSVALAFLATCHAASLKGRSGKSLRFEAPPPEPNVVSPLSFDQQLLVCNAYPGNFPVSIKHNGHESNADQRDIRFQECRHVSDRVRSKDKLDFVFANSGIQGTFEIGDLPTIDAMLLLVVERRDSSSPLVAFQSFAFPSHVDGKTAQLAVIDTFKGKSSLPHLRMEDHINTKEPKTISKRIEQLNFNHIYAIEEGTYDASISEHALENGKDGADTSKRTIHLAKKQNYVILRTGDSQVHQSLVVYPEVPRSAARHLSASLVSALLALSAALVF